MHHCLSNPFKYLKNLTQQCISNSPKDKNQNSIDIQCVFEPQNSLIIMSIPHILLLLLLSLSMHACNARYLGDLIKKEASSGNYQERTVSAVQQLKNDGGSNLIESGEVKSHLKEDETPIQTSGDDRVVVELQKGIQAPVKTEIPKRQLGRSILGSSTLHETEKPVDSKQADGDSVEHIDVMDYSQPHRKPPIHNERS